MNPERVRNIAIIAHVDHGKTTLVDKLLRQASKVENHREHTERAMDSNDLEKERGITILAKCTTVTYDAKDGEAYTINIVDTPGHADFGGEVERVLKMVDSVLLLVDAFEGPMPQTRFVLRKSLELGHRPIVVINKVDRPESRPDTVVDLTFDLFAALEAEDEQLDFEVIYASAKFGWAADELEDERVDMTPLFERILKSVPPPHVKEDAPFCMQIATLAYDPFLGRLAIGRIYDGAVKVGQRVTVCPQEGEEGTGKISKIQRFDGLEKVDAEEATAGEIVVIAGLAGILPGDTVCELGHPQRMSAIRIDEPTISMRFMVNTSPFAGLEGKFVTSRQIRERLDRELEADVSLRVEDTETPEAFLVSGRGELHLSILLERMRREGYELGVSQPRVVTKLDEDGKKLEPIERVVIECGDDFSGVVINKLNLRRGEMIAMNTAGEGMTRLEYRVPSRGLIGYRSQFATDTRGTGNMYTNVDGYEPMRGSIESRQNGALIAQDPGDTTGYTLYTLQDRGTLFVGPGTSVYGGQIIGQNAKGNDLVVNPNKKKALTNMRSSGADDKLVLSPAREMNLEAALEWISGDELVEITPMSIRIRKRELVHHMRKRR